MDTLRILFVVLEPDLRHDNLGVHAYMGPDPLHGGNIGRLKVHPRNYFYIFYSFELKLFRMVELTIPKKSYNFCFSIVTFFGRNMTSQD